ncbi:MAG: 50S ribosomal protein L11 methyltransferase [Muribaculaceae bacterium]|nr:50S ribosomal protein L11 methyltransferase [Muribaculaceae bacterium]
MNDYYKIEFAINPANIDACDLLAALLADEGYESFEPTDVGDFMAAYVPANTYNENIISGIINVLPIVADITYQASFIEGRDWNSEWEQNYFKPILVAGKVAIHSSFHTDIPKADYDITIDPRMAFGTGHHATTTLMIKSLLKSDISGKNVIDMGTGTGILAILSAMLGADNVVAVEIDPFAAENAIDNAASNLHGNTDKVKVIVGDASSLDDYNSFADIFLANINRNIITADIAKYAVAMRAGALITVSGFYVVDRPIVIAAASAVGLRFLSADDDNNWSSLTFIKDA